jgi:hypothetical protein
LDAATRSAEGGNMMEDGIYFEIFASKGGKRINFKIVSLRQLSKALTNGLMNALEEIIEIKMPIVEIELPKEE